MKNISKYKLTSKTTVEQLITWIDEKSDRSKTEIIRLISHRFQNRYLIHIKNIDSGFLIMAISCLMIETLQSFKEGKPDTSRIGKKIFKNFFKSEQNNFPGFYEISNEFYKDIRCGILHQSETTNAWRVLRTGSIIDKIDFSINAKEFLIAFDKSVKSYLDELTNSDFESQIWKNAIIKLKNICKNCEREQNR